MLRRNNGDCDRRSRFGFFAPPFADRLNAANCSFVERVGNDFGGVACTLCVYEADPASASHDRKDNTLYSPFFSYSGPPFRDAICAML